MTRVGVVTYLVPRRCESISVIISVQLLATSTKICTGGSFMQSRDSHFRTTTTLFLLLIGSIDANSQVSGVVSDIKSHPFSRLCDSAGELLHTPYADFNFHDHRPAVYTIQYTLSRLSEISNRLLFSPTYLIKLQVESLIASSAYQNWPTIGYYIYYRFKV